MCKKGDSYDPKDFVQIPLEPKEDGLIRVFSFNLRCSDVNGVPMPERCELAVRFLRQEQAAADVIGVQEATPDWMRVLTAGLPDYDYVGVGRDNGSDKGEYSAVFYKKDKYRVLDSGTFWLSETPEVPSKGWDAACTRICSYALLEDKQTGTRFAHANSHFDHVGEVAQQKEAEQVSAFVRDKFADVPCVFTADMNVLPTSEPYRIMTASLRDAAVTCADSVKRGTFHNAHPDKITDSTIDYVLYAGAWEPVHFRTVTVGIDDRFVSDHFPVYADMKLK